MNNRGDLLSLTGVLVLSLVLVGLLVLGVQYVGAGGSATVGGNSFTVYQCGVLNESGTYYLNQSITNVTGPDCLTIGNDSITIDGNGSTITGNINATNSTGPAFTNLVVQNVAVNGSIYSNAGNNSGNGGFNGGSVNVNNSNIMAITSVGFRGDMGGSSGNITIINSNVTTISSTGGSGDIVQGGFAGSITIINSNVTTISSTGGQGYGLGGGSSGPITITNSTTGAISSTGGLGSEQTGGSSGNITIINSNVTTISSTGGRAERYGGSSGTITIINSNVITISSTGGYGGINNGGFTGSITITNSTTGAISSTGGQGYSQIGGSSGSITISNSTTGAISSSGGSGEMYGGSSGSITISNSTTGAISSIPRGGKRVCGSSGTIIIINSNVTTIYSIGGSGWSGSNGSAGARLNFTDSVAISINVSSGTGGTPIQGGNVIVKNGTITSEKIGFGTNLTRIWYLEIKGVSSNLSVLAYTNISVRNKSNDFLLSSDLSDSYGIVREELIQYTNISGTTTYYPIYNYSISAALTGYASNVTNATFNMSTNRAISLVLLDNVAPVVTLTSASTGAIYSGSSYSVPFVWDATDTGGIGIANCSIYANGVGYVNTSVITDTNNNQNVSLNAGTYIAYINCTDIDGNTGNSSNITFTITAPAVENTGGTVSTPSASDSSLTEGVTRTLTAGTQFSFNFIGDSRTKEYHSLRVNSIYTNSAILTLYSTPIKFNITVGETKVFDTNGNGKNDVSVTLQGISFGRADVFVKKITELVAGNQTTNTGNTGNVVNQTSTNAVPETVPSGNGMSVTNIIEIIIGIIVLAIIIVGVLIYKNKRDILMGRKVPRS